MNPKTATIIGLRLLVIYLFFQIIPSIAFSLYSVTKPEYLSLTTIGYQLSQVALYVIPMIILIKYSDTIANKITRSVPDESFHSNLTSTNLLAILIAASAVFVINIRYSSFYKSTLWLHYILSDGIAVPA